MSTLIVSGSDNIIQWTPYSVKSLGYNIDLGMFSPVNLMTSKKKKKNTFVRAGHIIMEKQDYNN